MPSFRSDVIAFTEAFGPQMAPLILTMAQVPWPSSAVRDQFIQAMGGEVQDG